MPATRPLTEAPWPGLIRGLAWRAQSRNLDRIRPTGLRGAITVNGRKDGGGAQVHGQISALAFARRFGLKYVHSPLRSVEHNPGLPSEVWAKRWEDTFGLSELATDSSPVESMNIEVASSHDVIRAIRQGRQRLWALEHCHSYTDVFPRILNELRVDLRRVHAKAGAAPKTEYFSSQRSNIAVHLRRGDVSARGNSERYTSAQHTILLVEQAMALTQGTNQEVVIFSQGEDDDFDELRSFGARIVNESDVFVVLQHLIASDCLVMARSSLSYIAGMLRAAPTVYQPFWHPPMPDWHVARRSTVDILGRSLGRRRP